MSATSGNLEALKLFKVFRSILERRMSGTLKVRRGNVVKQARFAYGQMLAAASNRPEESVGRALVDEGLISSTERVEIETARRADRRSFEEHVHEKGLVAPARLEAIRRRLSRVVMVECFGWPEGTFAFEPANFRAKPKQQPIDLVELLLESAATRLTPAVCAHFVGRFGERALKATDWMETYGAEYDRLFPPPNLRGMLGSPLPASQITSMPGDKERNLREATTAVLAGLAGAAVSNARASASDDRRSTQPEGRRRRAERSVPPRPANVAPHPTRNEGGPRRQPDARSSTGDRKVRMRASNRPAARPPERASASRTAAQRPAASRPTANRSSASRSAPKRPASRPAARPAARRPAARPATKPAGGGRPMPDKVKVNLDRAKALAADIDAKNHYELLGLERAADEKAIRLAFRKAARDFHADRFARYDLDDETLAVVQRVFIAVNRANEVLSDATRRKEYDAALDLNVKPSAGNVRGEGAQLDQMLKAERMVKDATLMLSRGQTDAALDRLRKAMAVTPDDPLGQAALAYAEFMKAQAQGGSQVMMGRTREKLEEICAELENVAEPFLYLGRIYRTLDEPDNAIKALQRALKINPHLAEAGSELRHVQRKAEQSKSGLAGLFGRRKK